MKFYVNYRTEEGETSYLYVCDTERKANAMAQQFRNRGQFCWISNYAH